MAGKEIIQTAKDFIVLLSPLALGYLTYLGIKLSKQMDGITSERIGQAKAKAESDTKLQVIAEINPDLKSIVDLKPAETTLPVTGEKAIDVNIVDQSKPVEVKTKS